MAKPNDPLSPQNSPGVLKNRGVRRVNNLPLFIALAALTLFVAIIAMVAAKRADKQNAVPVVSTNKPHALDSSMMAEDIVTGQHSGIIPPSKPASLTDTALALPVAMPDNPNKPPRPPRLKGNNTLLEPENPELERIRLAKIQQFEAAVKAKMDISLPTQISATHGESNALTPAQNETDAKLAAIKRQRERVTEGDLTATYQARLQQIRAAMNGAPEADLNGDSADTAHQGDRWVLNTQVEAPHSPYELRTGAVIPGVMISGVKSMLPGQIIGQVSENVYDTATGKYLLYPQGTRLIGVYANEVAYGQDALLIAWQRMIFPDGKSLDIGSMPGADSAGFSGFHDQVNNHYVRVFGSALLMSGIVAGISYSQLQNQTAGPYGQTMQPTAGSVMSEALGQQLGQVTAQMIAKNLSIAPSLKIRPGYRFNIIVVKDMVFKKPYQSFDY